MKRRMNSLSGLCVLAGFGAGLAGCGPGTGVGTDGGADLAVGGGDMAGGGGDMAGGGGDMAAVTGDPNDSRFRPNPNGFKFENYGKDKPYENLTAVELRRMFGDKACGSLAGGTCTLTPAAKKWMESENKGMDGGRCEGFAIVSQLIYMGRLTEMLANQN